MQINLPIRRTKLKEIQNVISKFPQNKISSYDLITSKLLQMFLQKGVIFLTTLMNNVFR